MVKDDTTEAENAKATNITGRLNVNGTFASRKENIFFKIPLSPPFSKGEAFSTFEKREVFIPPFEKGGLGGI
jgi:hypothetical protein